MAQHPYLTDQFAADSAFRAMLDAQRPGRPNCGPATGQAVLNHHLPNGLHLVMTDDCRVVADGRLVGTWEQGTRRGCPWFTVEIEDPQGQRSAAKGYGNTLEAAAYYVRERAYQRGYL